MKLTFEEFESNTFEFEKILKQKCNKSIPINSKLEEMIGNIIELNSSVKNKISLDNKTDYRSDWRKIVGLSDLLKKLLYVKDHHEFSKLCPHILLLLGNTEIVQNIWSPASDQESNKIFELLVASSTLTIGENLEIENPYKSSDGKNPDVLIDINKTRWAFACKVLHSSNPKTYIDNLIVGINQIQNSNAEKGCVIINFKNIIDHNSIWPISYNQNQEIIYGTYKNYLLPTNILLNSFYNTFDEIGKMDIDNEYFPSLFKSKKALPISLNYLTTVVGTKILDQEFITTIKFIEPVAFNTLDQSDYSIIGKLNDSLQDRY